MEEAEHREIDRPEEKKGGGLRELEMIIGCPLVVLNRIQCFSPPSFLLLSLAVKFWPPAIAGGSNRQKCLWQNGKRVGDGLALCAHTCRK